MRINNNRMKFVDWQRWHLFECLYSFLCVCICLRVCVCIWISKWFGFLLTTLAFKTDWHFQKLWFQYDLTISRQFCREMSINLGVVLWPFWAILCFCSIAVFYVRISNQPPNDVECHYFWKYLFRSNSWRFLCPWDVLKWVFLLKHMMDMKGKNNR